MRKMIGKIGKAVLSFFMAVTITQISGRETTVIEASAKTTYSYYSVNCSGDTPYEVDKVSDSGGFTKQGCYASFEAAKTAMAKEDSTAVIRHSGSYSPSYIIAMNSGVAYSYPARSNSTTLTINDSTGSYSTYIPQHFELSYYETVSYDGKGDGKVKIMANGWEGYLTLKDIDLVPMKFIDKGLAIWLGGNDTSSSNEAPFSIICKHTVYTVEKNGNYTELRLTSYSGWPSSGTTPNIKFNSVIGPAADWMNVGEAYYSPDGIHFYSDNTYTNEVGTYYNYYQWLPLRTKSSIGASTLNSYLTYLGKKGVLNNNCDLFKTAEEKYGINALMLYAQACIESGYGTSTYATVRNNLFGVAAYDSDPDNASYFASVADSINQQAGRLLRSYCQSNTWYYYGGFFGNKGAGITVKYASAVYYGEAIAAIAYAVDKYDNNWNGSLTDFNSEIIGEAAKGAYIYSSPDGSKLYTSAFGSNYQKNSMVVIIGEEGDWYKVQSTNYLENGAVVTDIADKGYLTYDWDNFVGWMKKSEVTLVNHTETVDAESNSAADEADAGKAYSSVDAASWSSDGATVTLSGLGYIAKLNATDDVSHQLILVNMETKAETVIEASTYDPDVAVANDGKTYANIGWSALLDISATDPGNYYLKIRINNGNVTKDSILYTSLEEAEGSFNRTDGNTARLFESSLSRYRLELSIEAQNIDLSVIDKPTRRISLIGFNSLTMEDGKLDMDGYAFIYLTDTNASSNPVYNMILEDEEGNVVSSALNVKESPMNYGTLIKTKYEFSYGDFDTSVDLTQLPAGTYRLYADLTSGSYRDIFEMYNISDNDPLSMTYEGRTYELATTTVRSRYVLTITEGGA